MHGERPEGVTESTFAIDRDVGPREAAVRLRLTGRFDRAALPALQRAVIGELTRRMPSLRWPVRRRRVPGS
jgi:hypothetical protein